SQVGGNRLEEDGDVPIGNLRRVPGYGDVHGCRGRHGAKVVRGHRDQRMQAKGEPGREAERARRRVAPQPGAIKEPDGCDGATRLTNGGSNRDGIGIAEGGVVWRIRDGDAERRAAYTDSDIHDARGDRETQV